MFKFQLTTRNEHACHLGNKSDVRMPCLETLNQQEVIAHIVRVLHPLRVNVTLEVKTLSHDGQRVSEMQKIMPTFRKWVGKYFKLNWETNTVAPVMKRARDGLLEMFHKAVNHLIGSTS